MNFKVRLGFYNLLIICVIMIVTGHPMTTNYFFLDKPNYESVVDDDVAFEKWFRTC